MESNKTTYCQLCEREGDNIPLFQQYWWMETVCGNKQWDVLLVRNAECKIIGALPYLIGNKLGLRYILQPQLTQFCGPWYAANSDERTRQQANDQFVCQLKKLHLFYFQQNFAPEITECDLFSNNGYRISPRVTYRLDDISDPNKLFENFSRNQRQRRIRHLLPRTHCSELTPTQFADFQDECRKQIKQKNLLPKELVTDICSTALKRNQALLNGLWIDDRLIAALFVPYDTRFAYYLIPAIRQEGRSIGAMETLVWIMLQRLSKITQAFDFEGSMEPGIAQYYRSFGATPTTYLSLTKCPLPITL